MIKPKGVGDSNESIAMASHKGINATRNTIASRFYWHTITEDVKEHIKACRNCQLARNRVLKSAPDLHSISIPSSVFKQVGIDIVQMPMSEDGLKYVVVLVDYFSKWTEAEALKDKTAIYVARFIFNCICRHGCIQIQINDQGREFVNACSTELHRLSGTKQV